MIKFKKIRWRNFLSTGNEFIEIDLNINSTTLITGENGAGKSTILDAICYVLFGKAFRNINKPQLLNSINDKNCLVEVEFKIGKKDYRIKRGMKPGIFEIYLDNNLINQDSASRDYQKHLEEKILKLNYKSFTQIVILGSASFTPFMQLPLGHRREIIEDILDIQIFSVMNSILKVKVNELKEKIREIDLLIDIGKQKVKLQQNYILQLKNDQKKRKEDIQDKINEAKVIIKKLKNEVNTFTERHSNLSNSVENDVEIAKRRTEMASLYKSLQTKIKKIEGNITFYEKHNSCPTCSQIISTEFKRIAIGRHTDKKKEICNAIDSLYNKMQDFEHRTNEIIETKQQIVELQNQITLNNVNIIAQQNYIQTLQAEIQKSFDSETSLDDAKEALKVLATEVIITTENKSKFKEDTYYLDACSTLLKDTGIKTKIIQQYLPVINKLVNKYLAEMDFFVSFELDEGFNEIIKSRHRDDFSYSSFSEGEKQRIDLALLFTWRTIAKMKNSASTNLLLLDEVFDSSLDFNGTEFVMNLLHSIGDDINIVVISHKGDQLLDRFKAHIKFEKYQNFSRIIK